MTFTLGSVSKSVTVPGSDPHETKFGARLGPNRDKSDAPGCGPAPRDKAVVGGVSAGWLRPTGANGSGDRRSSGPMGVRIETPEKLAKSGVNETKLGLLGSMGV